MDITISETPVADVLSSGLFAELDAELVRRYPGEPIHGVDPQETRAAGGFFIVARVFSEDAGCGGFRPLDAQVVEIKRMFVRSRFLGRGVAKAILHALEAEARPRGFVRSILETGVRQPEAIALYRSAGYVTIEPFGPYVGSTSSVCLGKAL